MGIQKILIANRGEIAIRIARACDALRICAVMAHPADDANSLHRRAGDEAALLPGLGARAYLDSAAIIAAAHAHGCDAVHPGYGFLSEQAAFAQACADAGLLFIGPSPESLAAFGDKARGRALAQRCGAPVLEGLDDVRDAAEAQAFLDQSPTGAMMIKARAGGGGRGMRVVRRGEDVAAAFARCVSEAQAAFGDGRVLVEAFLPDARHIEVQIAADATGAAVALSDRDCTLQRRRQKVIEIAPSPFVSDALRAALHRDAVALAKAAGVRALATVEFLVDATAPDRYVFIEANPRLQVEHTVTEEALGVDLVCAQIELAQGATLKALGLAKPPPPQRTAIQARVCAETLRADGEAAPSSGVLTAYEPPTGPGVRVDGAGYAGYGLSPHYDSLLAKVIVQAPRFADAARKLDRALGEFRIEGAATNIGLLRAILREAEFLNGAATTTFVETNAADLIARAPAPAAAFAAAAASSDLAVMRDAPPGAAAARAPLLGTIVEVSVRAGDTFRAGAQIAVIEAMKMQHVVAAAEAGRVLDVLARPGETAPEGTPIIHYAPIESGDVAAASAAAIDIDVVRADLAEAHAAVALTLDSARPEAVARRRKLSMRTARENIADLVDPGTFIEYGALAVAAQRRRRTLDDLVANTPGDGMVTGVGSVNGALFDEAAARTAVLAYDYTVLAGTQGYFNHKKTDRLLHIAEDHRLPVVFFTEGGGGRPGDTDAPGVAGLDTTSFHAFARLSGLAPRIAIAAGRCFAGNAAFFGCADITVATRTSNIGMGGPAMIEGGGLGVFAPEDIGPSAVQTANGVIDVLVEDEADAVAKTKSLLGMFQGAVKDWTCGDQRLLRHAIPENRLRVYEVRAVIEALFDTGSFLELRAFYGVGVVTGFARIEGRPVGVVANNPKHLGGALDAEASEKAARFLQLCDAFDTPVVSLIDTPGFMVGPEAEKQAGVRRMSSLFVVGATVSIPVFAIVLRKCYGLGAQAMGAGSTLTPFFMASWPTGEFGGMGLEGAVRLGYRKELAAETDPAAQKALFEKLVANMYERGKAISMARALEIDAVIDPAETRAWLMRGLKSAAPAPARSGKKRPFIDTW